MTFQSMCRTLLVGFLTTWMATALGGQLIYQHDYRYNETGELAELTHANGFVSRYTYNQRGDQRSVVHQGFQIEHQTYNLAGQVTGSRYHAFNGQGLAVPSGSATLDYDPLGRLSGQALDIAGSGAYRATDISYDELGLVTGLTVQNGQLSGEVAYTYGSQAELLSYRFDGQTVQYHYDGHGNLTEHDAIRDMVPYSAAFDEGNPYHRDGWVYDAAGRLVEDDDYRYHYGYDQRLALIRDKHSRKVVAHYLYDADGRRVREGEEDRDTFTARDEAGNIASEEIFFHDGRSQIRNHLTIDGKGVAKTVYESEVLVEVEARFGDRLDNPVVRWSGEQTTHQQYSPYGQQLDADSTHLGPYGFTGVHSDDYSGLTYMQARYYDGIAGRFTRPDPAKAFNHFQPGSYNLYCYSLNNPVNFYDPDGNFSWPKGTGKLLSGAVVAIGAAVVLASSAPVVATAAAGVALYTGTVTLLEGVKEVGSDLKGNHVEVPDTLVELGAKGAEKIGIAPEYGASAVTSVRNVAEFATAGHLPTKAAKFLGVAGVGAKSAKDHGDNAKKYGKTKVNDNSAVKDEQKTFNKETK